MRFTPTATRNALFTLLTAGALGIGGITTAVAADDDWQSDEAGTSQSRTMESQSGNPGGFDQGGQGENGYGQESYDRDTQPGTQGGYGDDSQLGTDPSGTQGGFNEAPQQDQGGFDTDARPETPQQDDKNDQESAW